jgi:gas vesicle protein
VPLKYFFKSTAPIMIATVFEKIGEGANFTVGMLAKVAAGAGVAAAALKLIGLSTPWTAAIVGITGVVAAIAGIGIGAAKAEKEIKDSSINISDTVKQTAENLNSTIQSSKDQLNSVGDTYAGVKSVADKYFELADNFDNLTDSQKEMLIAYANYIVEQCPELADSIDTVTGEFKGQKDEVYNTISALEAVSAFFCFIKYFR